MLVTRTTYALFILSILINAPLLSADDLPREGIQFVSLVKENSFTHKLQKLVLTEAFKRNGLNYSVNYVPPRRALYMVNEGLVDGDAQRNINFTQNGENPNHIQIAESTYSIQWTAYTTNANINIKRWEDLKGKNYTVAYRSGNRLSEQNLVGEIDKDRLLPMKSRRQLLNMLATKRVDVAIIANQFNVQEILSENPERYAEVKTLGVLTESEVCAYLHVKLKHLAPQIAKTIRDMKSEGLLSQYKTNLLRQAAANSHP